MILNHKLLILNRNERISLINNKKLFIDRHILDVDKWETRQISFKMTSCRAMFLTSSRNIIFSLDGVTQARATHCLRYVIMWANVFGSSLGIHRDAYVTMFIGFGWAYEKALSTYFSPVKTSFITVFIIRALKFILTISDRTLWLNSVAGVKLDWPDGSLGSVYAPCTKYYGQSKIIRWKHKHKHYVTSFIIFIMSVTFILIW